MLTKRLVVGNLSLGYNFTGGAGFAMRCSAKCSGWTRGIPSRGQLLTNQPRFCLQLVILRDSFFASGNVSAHISYIFTLYRFSKLQDTMEVARGVPSASSSLDSNAIHQPLDPLLPEIRILKLLPSASFDAPLECWLVHRPLYGESPGYEALSYVWGEPKFTSEITLNNEQYFITPNLELAMRYLRRSSEERILWVDALCINQNDLVERSQQVLLMKDIYARCTVDLAWMLTHEEPRRLSEHIGQFHQAFELLKRISFKDAETLAKMRDRPSSENVEGTVPGRLRLNAKEERALAASFGITAIWFRIWTMQELSCAPQVRLVAGPHELDWAVVATFLGDRLYSDAFHTTFGHGGGGTALTSYFAGVVRVYDQRQALSDRNYRSTLLDTLARFQENRASDSRDCIYGLLGLVTGQHGIVVDYTKPTKQVFADIVVSIINASRDLDILCQTAWMTYSRSNNPHNLPSWVPDFSSSVYSHRGILFAQRGIYAAGREYIKAPCPPIDNYFLPVKATVLGCLQGDEIVKHNSPILWATTVEGFCGWRKASKTESNTWPIFGAPLIWLKASGLDIDILSGETQYMGTGEKAMRAYWRTLVMDCGAYPITRLTDQDMLETDLAFENIFDFLKDKLEEGEASIETYEKSIDAQQPNNNFIMCGGNEIANETLLSLWEGVPKEISTMWCRNYRDWMFSVTDNGLYTMVRNSKGGDIIASVDGAKVPLVLRERGSRDGIKTYSLVGTAYVHGYMDGEALDLVEQGALPEEEILLQ